ncbi:SRPBCC family protein [Micromonospora endolithica]|uniref:Polyketide cyclase n=1 Tax=Micromonospora endolithica TaxID=230091 RepID=A0A3A9ZL84_9ACTN|nr:SRPBCC family protein [Micromonospora endolithica]RKN49110.1 polyketide cyclase [Micromonospora endolithica]TWJ23263.1 polyketide cyclase/dehydrase/lipid transport protein [Micromonospora endolithica]
MRFEADTEVDADPARVWAVLVDVEGWPDWTPSVRRVHRPEPGPLTVGATALVEQPKLRPARWRVTELTDGRSFTWVSTAPGVRSRGEHRVVPLPDGRTRVELAIDQAGPLAGPVGWLYGDLVRRYLRQELDGLRRRCEQG